MCRSRGELGSCKDPFTVNVTLVENKLEIGVETVPCASGWCGKILESEDALKEGNCQKFVIFNFFDKISSRIWCRNSTDLSTTRTVRQ